MSDKIFDEYPASQSEGGNRASNGGHQTPHDVHNYAHPVGPTTFHHEGPGLADHTNHDNCGTQGRH